MLSTKYKQYELFRLPNNWVIEIYYGFINDPRFPGNKEFLNFKTRTTGVLRKIKLFKNDILVSEHIEDNPNYCSYKNKIKLDSAWETKGDEFKREITFDNGYFFKIEYWFSKNKQEPNRGIYYSKFRKLILYNQNKEIISEVIEENPNYRNPQIIDEFSQDDLL